VINTAITKTENMSFFILTSSQFLQNQEPEYSGCVVMVTKRY